MGNMAALNRKWTQVSATVAFAVALGACSNATRAPNHTDLGQPPTPLWSDTLSYVAAVMPGERLSVVVRDDEEGRYFQISLVDPSGAEVAVVPISERPDCFSRTAWAVAVLPTGELGFADRCLSELADPYGAVYSAGTPLCQTIYSRDELSDVPLELEIFVRGWSMPVGEDLAAAEDGCTQLGNADYPTYAPDGRTLALFALPAGGNSGQSRIDLPWALSALAEDGTSDVVLDGVREPRGLDWRTDGQLVFAGGVAGQNGLWIVNRNGSQLTRVGTVGLTLMSLDREGMSVLGVALPTHLPDDARDLVLESVM